MAENENIGTEEVPEDLPGIRGFIQRLRGDFDAHDHSGSNSKGFKTLRAETLSSRASSIRKSNFNDNTAGMWAGLVGNTMKMFLGTASAYMKWTGTALQIAGDIVAGSLTIGDNASIDSSGNATFISMTSLNIKAYTNFESSGRFTLTGDVAATFGNQGLTVAPGTTADHYARAIWYITGKVFENNPTFTASLLAFDIFDSGDGWGWVGLGSPTAHGTNMSTDSKSACGFRFAKSSGITTLAAVNNDGGSGTTVATNLTTVTDGDSIEIMLKMTAVSIKYYYRKNGGTLTLGATHTTRIPTAAEDNIVFLFNNAGTTTDFKPIIQCAAYEH